MTKRKEHPVVPPSIWNDANIAILIQMWGDGCSATQIEKKIRGASRSAVIGKVHRLGLTRDGTTTRLKYRQAMKARATPHKSKPAPKAAPLPPPVALKVSVSNGCTYPQPESRPLPRSRPEDLSTARPWLTRGYGDCAFPVAGEGADTLSCCAHTEEGETYCPAHKTRMVQKTRTPEQIAADEARSALMRAARAHTYDANNSLFRRRGRAA